ncbi:unnamed protein product [Pieris brassicae]|uniref:Uncharacterized protein n=1 Tax=Pieris brassicae TaxID=7116 RepID=A0A9P0XAB6_PIEBR|nr:unnamed protein product [Pieris brassicae]
MRACRSPSPFHTALFISTAHPPRRFALTQAHCAPETQKVKIAHHGHVRGRAQYCITVVVALISGSRDETVAPSAAHENGRCLIGSGLHHCAKP